MFYFFQQNSFLITFVVLWIAAVGYIFRSGAPDKRLTTIAVITAVLAALYYSLSPRDISPEETVEIDAVIGRGRPVLIEIKSPN